MFIVEDCGRFRKNSYSKKFAFKFLFDKINNEEIIIHNKLKHKNITQIIGIHSLLKKDDVIGMEFAKFGDIINLKKKL